MAINQGYASLSQVKSALRITDNVDDGLLEMAIESASRAIDSYTNRNFYNAGTATRLFAPVDSQVVVIDDLISLSELQSSSDTDPVFDEVFTVNDYQLEPLNGVTDGVPQPFTQVRAVGDYLFNNLYGEATVKITGVWGWASVPIQVTQATIIQASRIYKRLDSPLGIISGELGSMRVGSRIDPDVAQLIDSLRKIKMA